MSSCAREKGGALHSLLTQQSAPPPPPSSPPPPPPPPSPACPPQAWPTTRKAAEKMREARRLKNIVKNKEQRQRRKARKLEAKLKAKEDHDSRLLLLVAEDTSVEEPKQLSLEAQASAAVPRVEEEDTTREAPAALVIQRAWRAKKARRRYSGIVIQRAWRTKVVRARYARACALKQAEKRRQRLAVRSIHKAWRQFQARKALAYAKARVNDKMAPHRRKRAELMRAVAAAAAAGMEDAEPSESSNDGLGCGHSASAAAAAGVVTDEEGPRASAGGGNAAAAGAGALAGAGAGAGAAGEAAAAAAATAAGAAAAQMPAVGVAGLASGRLGNVLLDMIAATRRRKEEEAAARAAVNAQARAEFEAIFAASEAEMAAREEAEEMERAALAQDVLKKTFKVLRDQYAEAIRKKKARLAQIRPLIRLPASRKHADTASAAAAAVGPTMDLVPHPFQSLQGGGGDPPQYSQRGVGFREVVDRLKGVPLPLGVAPVWGVTGVPRLAEQFAAACGFSAAFGPLLLQRAAAKVFGKEAFSSGVRGGEELPEGDVAYVFGRFWEDEIAPFGPAERFFRLVGNPGRGGIVKEELRPFLMAIAERHADLAMLTPDDVSAYVDTVLAVLYHAHSRCGIISLRDLRTSGFVTSLNATGRLELGLEDSECLSVSRHETIRGEYLSLCCGGRGVGHAALRGYRHKGGAVVGAVRASRVIEADSRRQRSRCNSSAGVLVPTVGGEDEEGSHGNGDDGQKQQLGYDAWVRFFLCEEGLRAGECSERDVRFCFDLVDAAAAGRVGVEEVAPFYDDMKREYVSSGGNPDKFKASCDNIFCQNLDAMGVEAGRQYVTAVEMLKAGNVKIAGRFFSRLFLGLQFKRDKNAAKKRAENRRPPPPPTAAVPCQQPLQQQYVQCPSSPGYQQYPWYPQHEYQHQPQYLGFQQQYQGQYQGQYQDPYQGYQQYSPHQQYEPLQQQQFQQQQQQQHRAQPQVYDQNCQQAYPAWDAGCQWQQGYAGDGQSCRN